MNIGLNGVAMSPHGLTFDEDEATGCPMPLEPFPTPFRFILGTFKAIFRSKGFEHVFSDKHIYIGGWGGGTNREIVSCRACVRARGFNA